MNLFEFYVDGDKFYDVRIDELALIDPVLELETNAAGTFTFTIPPLHPKYDSFNALTSTIEIYRDGEWFWEGRIINEEGDFWNNKKYTVEGALGYLNDSIQPQYKYQGNPIGYVERILNVHNSMVPDNRKIYLGAVTVTDPNGYIYCYTNYNCTLQELKEDIIDDLGGFVRLRKVNGKLYLDILAEPDRICSQIIRVGENLIDLTPGFDYTDIASVIIPLGATLEDQEDHSEGLEDLDKYVEITEVNGGKNYIARNDLLDLYDQIWQVVQFSDIHTPENLLRKAKEYLTDGQWGEMVIQAKAFDLNYTSEAFQEFRLNDRIRVKSELHGIDRYFPLTAQTFYFNAPQNNTITLGGTGEPVSITGITNKVTINSEKLSERIKDPNRLIQQAIYQATQLINQGLNGYVRVNGNEILIMDTDDPATAKHVWRWNMGGLGYSNNGYNGPFETAITMDGTIVGKFIAANSIAAEQIDVNYTDHVTKEGQKYVDGKLVNYYTQEQTETYFRNEAGKWEMGVLSKVDTTLGNYTTTEYFESQLTLTKEQFNTTLKNYSDTKSVQSMIDQTAEKITTSVDDKYGGLSSKIEQTASSITSTVNGKIDDVYSSIQQTKDEITTTLKGYAKSGDVSELQQKVTTDGIFTTINTGLKGSKSFSTTKYTMDKDGLTIQGGGLTVKNNAGTSVLYADTSGNLTLSGTVTTVSGGSGWQIKGDTITYYSGSSYKFTIDAQRQDSTDVTALLGYSRPIVIASNSFNSYMRVGTDGITLRVMSDDITFDCGGNNINVKVGGVPYSGVTQYVTAGGQALRFMKGMLTSITGDRVSGLSGTLKVGNVEAKFESGFLTGLTGQYGLSGNVDVTSSLGGKYRMTFTNGVLTGTKNL